MVGSGNSKEKETKKDTLKNKEMQNQNFNVDIKQTTELTCESCDNNHFQQVFMMRKLSPLLSPTGEPTLIPIPVYACTKCNHVNSEFLPKDL